MTVQKIDVAFHIHWRLNSTINYDNQELHRDWIHKSYHALQAELLKNVLWIVLQNELLKLLQFITKSFNCNNSFQRQVNTCKKRLLDRYKAVYNKSLQGAINFLQYHFLFCGASASAIAWYHMPQMHMPSVFLYSLFSISFSLKVFPFIV